MLEQRGGELELTVRKDHWYDPDSREMPDLEKAEKERVKVRTTGREDALEVLGLSSAETTVFTVDEDSPARDLVACQSTCETDEDCSLGSECTQGRCAVPVREEACVSGARCAGSCAELTEPQGDSLVEGDWVLGYNGGELQRWHHMLRKLYEHPERMHRLDVRRGDGQVATACFFPRRKW